MTYWNWMLDLIFDFAPFNHDLAAFVRDLGMSAQVMPLHRDHHELFGEIVDSWHGDNR